MTVDPTVIIDHNRRVFHQRVMKIIDDVDEIRTQSIKNNALTDKESADLVEALYALQRLRDGLDWR